MQNQCPILHTYTIRLSTNLPNDSTTATPKKLPFTTHFHPSVKLYACHLLSGEPISTNPELHHHTLARFLDRFVYRNARATPSTKGSSIMQPAAALDGPANQNRAMALTRKGAIEHPVNSIEFWRRKVDDVPVDQVGTCLHLRFGFAA